MNSLARWEPFPVSCWFPVSSQFPAAEPAGFWVLGSGWAFWVWETQRTLLANYFKVITVALRTRSARTTLVHLYENASCARLTTDDTALHLQYRHCIHR